MVLHPASRARTSRSRRARGSRTRRRRSRSASVTDAPARTRPRPRRDPDRRAVRAPAAQRLRQGVGREGRGRHDHRGQLAEAGRGRAGRRHRVLQAGHPPEGSEQAVHDELLQGAQTAARWTGHCRPSTGRCCRRPGRRRRAPTSPRRRWWCCRRGSPGWNKYVVAQAVPDVAAIFGDAQIVWKGTAAYSANPATAALIAATPGVRR